MKKARHLTICFFVLSSLFIIDANCQQNKNYEYLINGTIKGIDSGSVRMLSDDGERTLNSSIIVNGKFLMHGEIDLPERRLFSIKPGNWSFRAFVEKTGGISLIIDTAGAEHFGEGANKWALIWEIGEKGSEIADVYKRYNDETHLKFYRSCFTLLNEKLKAFKSDTTITAKLKQEIDSINKLAISTQKVWIENYIHRNPSSVAGIYLFDEFYETSYSDISPTYLHDILDQFSGLAKASIYYKSLENTVANLEHKQINSVAPDFTLLTSNKTNFTLSTTFGSYILIDFWASWCAPCRAAIPSLKKAYAKFHKKNFRIVSVSTDRDWSDWIKALKKEQMPWTQVIDEFPGNGDPSRVAELFGVPSLPFYVLIDKEGTVILSSGSEDVVADKLGYIFH